MRNRCKFGIGGRTYDELKKTLNAYISEKNYDDSKRINGKKAASLKNSMFRNSYNYLCYTYVMKNLVKSKVESFVNILQMFHHPEMKKRLKNNQREFPIQEDFNFCAELIGIGNPSNLSRNINEMAELGYIEIDRKKNNRFIKIAENPIDCIDNKDEAMRFLDAAALMRNCIEPYLCGNMLFQTALNTFREKGLLAKYENPYIIADSHFEQVLDDEVLWQIMQAIGKRRKIEFDYRSCIF